MIAEWIDRPPFLRSGRGVVAFSLQARLSAAVVIVAGASALLGLALDVSTLQRIVPSSPAMRANTAAALVLAGCSLWLHAAKTPPAGRQRSAALLGSLVLAIGALTLAQYLFGVDLHIDTLLFPAPDAPGPVPARMAPNTAIAFTTLGLVLTCLDVRRRALVLLLDGLTLLTFFAAFIALCGYAYGARALTGWSGFTAMALNTAFAVLVLSVGLLLVRADRGLLAVLAQDTVSAATARRLLPFLLLLPFSLGLLWVRGEKAGLYETEFGLALMVGSSTFIVVTVLLVSAAAMTRVEQARASVLRDERFLLDVSEEVRSASRAADALAVAARALGLYLGASRCEFVTGDGAAPVGSPSVVRVSLPRGEHPKATLVVAWDTPRVWTAQESSLIESVAERAWLSAEKLETSERARTVQLRFAALIEASAQIVLTTDPEGRIIEDSPSWRAFTGQTFEQFKSLSRRDAAHPADIPSALRAWREALEAKKPLRLEYRLRRADGEWRWVSLHAVPRLSDEGQVLEWVQMISDITPQKLAELELRGSEERFRLLAEGAREYATMMLDPDGRITTWNLGAERLFGYRAEEIVGQRRGVLYTPEDIDAGKPQLELEVASREGSFQQEAWRVRKDGSRFLAEVSVTALRHADGTLLGFGKVTRDVTELRRAQDEKEALLRQLREANASLERRVAERTETLSSMLAEREVLLQEIHHRVKNNLQMISSLLNMQARALPLPEARAGLEDCRRRVEAIGLIHEDLYRSRDYARVPFAEHVKGLVTNIVQSFTPADRITVRTNLEPLFLPVDRAIPCGLILNELLTNALKHAFPGERAGTVSVAFHRVGDDLVLEVSDDGVGLEPGFDPGRSASLGMRLVTILTRQLDGHLAWNNAERGAVFRVTFPMGRRT